MFKETGVVLLRDIPQLVIAIVRGQKAAKASSLWEMQIDEIEYKKCSEQKYEKCLNMIMISNAIKNTKSLQVYSNNPGFKNFADNVSEGWIFVQAPVFNPAKQLIMNPS